MDRIEIAVAGVAIRHPAHNLNFISRHHDMRVVSEGKMSNISLRFAGGDYWDRTRPLIDGTIRPAGIPAT